VSSLGRYSRNSLRRFISSLNSIRFRDDVGEVEFFGQKMVMLRRDAFNLMRKEIARVAGTASDIILGLAGRRVGWEEGGALLTKAESLGLKATESFPEFVRVAVEETNMGYGKMKLVKLDLASGLATVSILNSFEAEPFGTSQNPSCVFALSYLEGLFSKLLGRDVRGSEGSCRAQGKDLCVFNLAPKLGKETKTDTSDQARTTTLFEFTRLESSSTSQLPTSVA
jgi:predicted hydrocarbon binding protein